MKLINDLFISFSLTFPRVHSDCCFVEAVSFPDVLHVGLSVAQLGPSSVVYNVGIFKREVATACAYGRFVHVFTGRKATTPEKKEMPKRMFEALEKLIVGNGTQVAVDSGGASMKPVSDVSDS